MVLLGKIKKQGRHRGIDPATGLYRVYRSAQSDKLSPLTLALSPKGRGDKRTGSFAELTENEKY